MNELRIAPQALLDRPDRLRNLMPALLIVIGLSCALSFVLGA